MKSALWTILPLIIFIPLASSQTCNTAADADCNGLVNMTELTHYINLWYSCSSCAPDLIDVMTAYYNPACVPDCAGRQCGDDGCGGSCGTCGSGYYCSGGSCIEGSCTEDCSLRGPGFICNSTSSCEWVPPIGIPKPDFGIEETYRMYDEPENRNPALAYINNSEGGYYTHYIDGSRPCNDLSTGTAANPRCTVPGTYAQPLPEGSVVELHGGPYAYGSISSNHHQIDLYARGSRQMPIFIRSFMGENVVISNMWMRVTNSTFLVIENLNLSDSKIYFHNTIGPSRHVSLRNLDVHGGPPISTAALGISFAVNVVAYNNHLHDNGDPNYYDENDFHAVLGGSFDNATPDYEWIVDNHMHGNGGDSVQINSQAENMARYIYIGRNVMHGEGENGVDLKQCKDVVVSENIMHDFRPSLFAHSGSDGTALVINDDKPHVDIWVINNRIYNSTNAIRFNDGGNIIGNVIYNISNTGIVGYYAAGSAIIAQNTLYDVNRGIAYGGNSPVNIMIENNIISDVGTSKHLYIERAVIAATTDIRGTLFHEPDGRVKISWGNGDTFDEDLNEFVLRTGECAGCIDADPQFFGASSGNFSLLAGSPAVGSGAEPAIYGLFEQLYGLSIRKDIDGNPRPQGSGWDIGAHEYCGAAPGCQGTDASCGIYPSCTDCNDQDGCSGLSYRDYYCSGTACAYGADSCDDCSCSCGGFSSAETAASGNCGDGIDNDCDGLTDTAQDPGCRCTPGQTQPCSTGLQGICSTGTLTCQPGGAWGSCVQDSQPVAEVCTDTFDNDCDGTTDCGDVDCSAAPACQDVLPLGYISYWRFDGDASDETGAHAGLIRGNASFVADPVRGTVLSLDGAGDYVEIGDIGDVEGMGSITISAWIKTPRSNADDGT